MLTTVFFATVRSSRCVLKSRLFLNVTGISATRSCWRFAYGLKGKRVRLEGLMPTRSLGRSC